MKLILEGFFMNNLGKLLIISAFTFSGITFAVSMKDLEQTVKNLKSQTRLIKSGDRAQIFTFNATANKIAAYSTDLNGQATGPRSSTIDDAAKLIERHANVLASLWHIFPSPARTIVTTLPTKDKKELEGLWQSAKKNFDSRKTMAASLIEKFYFGSRKDVRQQILDAFKVLDNLQDEFKKWGKPFFEFIK
jgi:hypothetical protein